MPVTVFVADHTEIARRAVCQLLENHAGIRLVGEASSFGETIRMARELQPQVLVVDVHMPDNHSVTPEDFKALLAVVKSRLVVISISVIGRQRIWLRVSVRRRYWTKLTFLKP